MKACPFCAEQIQDDAKKCRHCGEWLDGPAAGACPCGRSNAPGALICVGCGSPLRKQPSTAAAASGSTGVTVPAKVQVIERTGKGWKAAQLAGGAICFFGLAACCATFSTEATADQRQQFANTGVRTFFAGFAIWLVARIGAWWHHG